MIYTHIAAALIAASAAALGTYQVQEWRYGAKEAERLEAAAEKRRMDSRGIDVAAVGHEKDKVRIRFVTKTVTKEIERVVKEPYYVESAPACFDERGLQLISESLGTADPASQPARALPRPDRTR